MHPTIYEIPLWGGRTLPLHSYGLMIVIGFLLAVWITRKEVLRRGLPDVAYDLGIAMLLSGLLGGRIFYYLQFYDEKFRHESFLEFFKIWKGGLVFYGGALGGVLGGLAYVRWKKLPLLDCMDATAMGAPAGMAFGRIGCFLNGCCYGAISDPSNPLSVVFPVGSPAKQDHWNRGLLDSAESLPLAVHPTQLYQAGHDFLLLLLLVWYLRRPDSVRGIGMPLLFILYGIGRFTLEFLRADNAVTATGLTISQNLSLLGVLAFGILAVLLLRRARSRRPEPQA